MALLDVTQYKRKLKHPQLRKWTYDGNEWGYQTYKPTAKNIATIYNKKSTNDVHYQIAFKGKEYTPKEFIRKFPKFKSKMKEYLKKQKIAKQWGWY